MRLGRALEDSMYIPQHAPGLTITVTERATHSNTHGASAKERHAQPPAVPQPAAHPDPHQRPRSPRVHQVLGRVY